MFLQKCLDLIYFLAGRSENNPSKCTQNRWARVSSMFRLSRPDGGSANDYCRHRRSVICQSQWLILKVSRLFLFSTNGNHWLKNRQFNIRSIDHKPVFCLFEVARQDPDSHISLFFLQTLHLSISGRFICSAEKWGKTAFKKAFGTSKQEHLFF